ncbi:MULTISPECIES: hypothetical protein [unclassified Nocardia]|uniref:hypothetical protein n=1 Tax=unclassified Nocardia TaxID=2637762 RepID=UPI001CE3DC39|nr:MULTISPECIES: hypothetical protein [unclassified Nocardia]
MSTDSGLTRTTCEAFAQFRGDRGPDGEVSLTLHQERGFAAVVHLTMTTDDALAVLGVLSGAVQDALDARAETQGKQPVSPCQLVSPIKVVTAQEVR